MAEPLCILAAGKLSVLMLSGFTLDWTHSVEKTLWRETWVIEAGRLRIEKAFVEAAGAGMDLPANATRVADGWDYVPALPPQRELVLAASGATVSAWHLCANGQCRDLGASPGAPVRLFVGADPACTQPAP